MGYLCFLFVCLYIRLCVCVWAGKGRARAFAWATMMVRQCMYVHNLKVSRIEDKYGACSSDSQTTAYVLL